jgi:hypothetical protein
MLPPLLLFTLATSCKHKDNARELDGDVKPAVARLEKRLATPLPVTAGGPSAVRREQMISARRSSNEDCMWLAHIDGANTVVRDASLLATYTRICNHDVQLWMLHQLADAAEAARKAAPAADMLPECDATDLFIATDELKKNKTADAESAALEARFTAACAPSPSGSAATGSAASGSAAH